MIVITGDDETALAQVAHLYLAETRWTLSGAAREMMGEESQADIQRRRSVCERIVNPTTGASR